MGLYSNLFYKTRRKATRRSADAVLPWVFDVVPCRSVADAGCGTGSWLAAARDLGVADVAGYDGPWVREDLLEIPADRFHATDLSHPPAPARTFDLAISLEVAEHLPKSAAPAFVRFVTNLAPVVLFSAAIPGQGGMHHVNEQWPGYWIDLFASHGYRAVDAARGRFWEDRKVAYWYAQNAFFFVRKDCLSKYPKLLEAETRYGMGCRAAVHPRHAERSLQFASVADLLRAFPTAFARTVAAFGTNPPRDEANAPAPAKVQSPTVAGLEGETP